MSQKNCNYDSFIKRELIDVVKIAIFIEQYETLIFYQSTYNLMKCN